MDFTGNIGFWQRRIAECPEGVARRMSAMEALGVEAGQSILDVGCGGGHLVRELALTVGDRGRAVGLDASSDQLNAAREVCDGLSAAELVEGSATQMDFPEATFDGLASIQTMEYVSDVDKALVEARRVLKHGGQAALISVLWDHFRFHGAEAALNGRVLYAFRTHCPHQMLPMELPGKLKTAGFGGVMRRPIAFMNGALHENALAYWAAKIVAVFAIGQGIAEEDAQSWLEQLDQANKEGRFGFVSVPVLTTATAI